MIEFFSLFLGLTGGLQPVELLVLEPIVEVELRLDGRSLGTVAGEPWSFDCDFGALAPHELVAIGRDADGREVERIRQWINLAPSREVEDGQIEVSDLEQQEHPDLSPVAVTLAPGAELPAAGEMSSWFHAGGEPVAVVAVERGPAEVVIVRDPAVQPELYVLADSFYEAKRGFLGPTFKGAPPESAVWFEGWIDLDPDDVESPYQARILAAAQKGLRKAAQLGPGAGVRFLSPWTAPLSQVQTDRQLYAVSDRIPVKTKGFLEITNEVTSIPFAFRLADAVALAGSELHDAGRRRAVVILMGAEKAEESQFTPAPVRAYLRQLQVPLFVWSAVSDAHTPRRRTQETSEWGDVRHVGFNPAHAKGTWANAFRRAAGELRENLASQRIVWLAGRHLPQSIELAEDARGLSLAGGTGGSP